MGCERYVANQSNRRQTSSPDDRHLLGIAAPETWKIAVMAQAGYQAELSVYITGLDAKAKAESFRLQSLKILDQAQYQVLDFQMHGTPKPNPQNQSEATVQLRYVPSRRGSQVRLLTFCSLFAQAREKTALSPGKFLGPILSNQLQGYPGLQPHLDYRAAAPKPYVTYFPGLMLHSAIQQRVHYLSDASQGSSAVFDVPANTAITPTDRLPKEQNVVLDTDGSTSDFGPTMIAPLGHAVYSRSGDKGSNVNVGFFFPMGKDMSTKWEWLRTFLTLERFTGKTCIVTSPLIPI